MEGEVESLDTSIPFCILYLFRKKGFIAIILFCSEIFKEQVMC